MTHLDHDHDAPILDDSPQDTPPPCGIFPIVYIQKPQPKLWIIASKIFYGLFTALCLLGYIAIVYVCLVWLGVMR